VGRWSCSPARPGSARRRWRGGCWPAPAWRCSKASGSRGARLRVRSHRGGAAVAPALGGGRPADRGAAGRPPGAAAPGARPGGAGRRPGDAVRGRPPAGLAMALEHGLTGPAAEIYQRLADAFEHGGDYPAAKDTYDEAFGFCATNAIEPTAQLCLACLTAVLRQSGDWDRAVTLCRQVIASSEATFHARVVATGSSARSSASVARPGEPGRCCWNRSPWPAGSSWRRWRSRRPGGSPSWTRPRVRPGRRLATAGRSSSAGGRPRTGTTRSRPSAGRRASSPSRGRAPGCGPARRRWPGSPPTSARPRRCRRCRMRWARRRCWTGARSRRRASSPGPWRCWRASTLPSTGRSRPAAPALPWPRPAGVRKRWSSWSPPTARPGGWGRGRCSNR
jgi:hypothetical protein